MTNMDKVSRALEETPDGLTTPELAAATGIGETNLSGIVGDLRRVFAEDDSINVITFIGNDGAWRYKLVGDVDSESEWFMQWMRKRARSTLSTTSGVFDSLAMGLDGRTAEGRWAKRVNRQLVAMVAELDDLEWMLDDK